MIRYDISNLNCFYPNLCSSYYSEKGSPKHRYLYDSLCFLSKSHTDYVAKRLVLFLMTLSLLSLTCHICIHVTWFLHLSAKLLFSLKVKYNKFPHYFPVYSTLLQKYSTTAHPNANNNSLFFDLSPYIGAWLPAEEKEH